MKKKILSDPIRIVYMGTPDFALPALLAIQKSRHEIVGILTNPDRPAGRGKTMHQSAIKKAALEFNIPAYQPQRLRKNKEAFTILSEWKPDICVVAAYGQILPQKILDIPTLACVNIHASLLPKYRGAAPINWSIVRGESETGLTTMLMEKGLDTGPMLQQISIPIPPNATAQDIHDELSLLGAAMILPTIEGLIKGSITPEKQNDNLSSYAPMMEKSDGRINWKTNNLDVHNLIRGMNPWPGAHALLDGKKIKIHASQPLNDDHLKLEPGQIHITKNELIVGCLRGQIKILEIQPPNKKKMSAKDFLNGRQINQDHSFS